MSRPPTNGVYLDESFGPRRRSPGYLLKVGLVYLGMFLSVMLFAAGLLGLVWVMGVASREVLRWMQS